MGKIDLRVCVMGDSYVAGYGDETGRGWPGRVLERAWAQGADLTLYNLGVRRETGPQIAARLAEIAPRLSLGDRGAVIVAFGANDIDLGVEPRESLAALMAVRRHAAEHGHAAFVLSPPVFIHEPEFDAKVAELTTAMAEVCAAEQTPFLNLRQAVLDWSAWWEEALAADGAHPNRAYALISDAISAWQPWRSWLGV